MKYSGAVWSFVEQSFVSFLGCKPIHLDSFDCTYCKKSECTAGSMQHISRRFPHLDRVCFRNSFEVKILLEFASVFFIGAWLSGIYEYVTPNVACITFLIHISVHSWVWQNVSSCFHLWVTSLIYYFCFVLECCRTLQTCFKWETDI